MKKGRFYHDYFLMGDLDSEKLLMVEKVLKKESVSVLKNIINESAELAGREYRPTVLRDKQTIPVAMSHLNSRLFIGDKPGLGKTVMSTAAYALYRKKMMEKGLKPKKLLLVTENKHVVSMSKEMSKYFGVNMVPLYNGTAKVERDVKKFDIYDDEIDGVTTTWGTLKSNGFLFYYLNHVDAFGVGIFDETSRLKTKGTQAFQVADDICNHLNGGLDKVIFLNGSSFEKSIYDIYNQFMVLSPRLFPSKKFIDDHYVVKGGRKWWTMDIEEVNGTLQQVRSQKQVGEIVDYRNQEDLKKRIRHHYIARSKADFSKDLPKHNYVLRVVEMTSKQKERLEQADVVNSALLNSPRTSDPDAKFDEKNVPKLADLMELYESIVDYKPIVYVYHKESQRGIRDMFKERGYTVELLNGDTDPKKAQEIIDRFNRGKIDTLVFNLQKAVNIPGSDAVIMYDIPTVPEHTNQIMGRIDRDNYEKGKFYYFLAYADSPEMGNIIRLAYFREKHGSLFTGQKSEVYQQLTYQLQMLYDEEDLEELERKIKELDYQVDELETGDIPDNLDHLF